MLRRRLRALPKKLPATLSWAFRDEVVVLAWATEGVVAQNWGDKLNPWLASRISGKRVLHRAQVYPLSLKPIHYWIGSHLSNGCADRKGVVWGAGFISSDAPIRLAFSDIRAVRGWLSHQRLREAGAKLPEVVGDAALLLPRFYTPKRNLERRTLGLIPHCYERDQPFFRQAAREWEDVRIIDICGGIEEVVEQIVACDRIASSSLHGIICADSYGVPAVWLHASDKPKGDGFKFRDYFSSVGRRDQAPLVVTEQTGRAEVEDLFYDYRIDIDLDALWDACPLKPDA